MMDDEGFLNSIKAAPGKDVPRLVYADWLDERADPRGAFLRLNVAMSATAPDHVDRVAGEQELSLLRKGCDAAWLASVDPWHVQSSGDPCEGRGCPDGDSGSHRRGPSIPYFHVETQDTECDAWKRLLDLIDEAATDGREEFAPLRGMSPSDRAQVLTLPPSIAGLKSVKTLHLYGSHLVRIPPEIGEMTSLETFVPYTSYRLHWFPYEITRCRSLRDSTVSTRALHGNYKYRSPFPRLDAGAPIGPGRYEPERLPIGRQGANPSRPCSVCGHLFEDRRLHRMWLSLPIATDVLPLLVNACSEACIAALPPAPDGYVKTPHQGGVGVRQPGRP